MVLDDAMDDGGAQWGNVWSLHSYPMGYVERRAMADFAGLSDIFPGSLTMDEFTPGICQFLPAVKSGYCYLNESPEVYPSLS